MTAKDFRDLLVSYLTDPAYADVLKIDDEEDVCLGMTLPDEGGRFFVKIEKMAVCVAFPGESSEG